MPLNIEQFLEKPTAVEFNSLKKAELRQLAQHLNVTNINVNSTKEDIRELLMPLLTFVETNDNDDNISLHSTSSQHKLEELKLKFEFEKFKLEREGDERERKGVSTSEGGERKGVTTSERRERKGVSIANEKTRTRKQ